VLNSSYPPRKATVLRTGTQFSPAPVSGHSDLLPVPELHGSRTARSWRNLLFVVLVVLVVPACDDTETHLCVKDAICDPGNPCTRGAIVCGADDVAHCVVQEVTPDCPAEPPPSCVEGASCDTGDPCRRGTTVCGADYQAHCVATRVLENCPSSRPSSCVEGVTCDTGNPCHRGAIVCGADDRAHCVVTVIEDVPGCP
jgi:hypothetical protein